MLRLLRLLRVTRLLRAVGGTALVTNPVSRAALQHISTAVLYLLNLIFSLAVLVNLLGCLRIFIAQIEGFENSWVAATGEGCSGVPAVSRVARRGAPVSPRSGEHGTVLQRILNTCPALCCPALPCPAQTLSMT